MGELLSKKLCELLAIVNTSAECRDFFVVIDAYEICEYVLSGSSYKMRGSEIYLY